jgi:hypothetical protein
MTTTSTDTDITGVAPPVARRLRTLLDTNGVLTTHAVLTDAADPASPLHHIFEWDDTEAANKYRHTQARTLIARVRIRITTPDDTEPVNVRAYVSRTDIGRAGEQLPPGSYIPVEDIAGGTDAEASILRAIRRDIHRLHRKYHGYEVLLRQELVAAADDPDA